MINYEFLIVCYFIGLFIDWIFQWSWQANNKSKWDKLDDKKLSMAALLDHSFTYAILTSIITTYLIKDFSKIMVIFLVLFISHAIIDTRIIVKCIMRFKGMSVDQICDYKTYGFMHIGIDHRLHELTILILSLIA